MIEEEGRRHVSDAVGVDGRAMAEGAVDVPGLVLRVRRICDMSQRDLGHAIGLDQSHVARIESSHRRVELPLLTRILALAGMRIAVLDRDGAEVAPVPPDVFRDNAGRRMPAHLDVRTATEMPASVVLSARHDRATPQAWYQHRFMRDRLRSAGDVGGVLGGGAAPDQPTRSDLTRLERRRRQARLERARQQVGALVEFDCTCSNDCWASNGCADACTCGCGE